MNVLVVEQFCKFISVVRNFYLKKFPPILCSPHLYYIYKDCNTTLQDMITGFNKRRRAILHKNGRARAINACLNCRLKHARCSIQKPCKRCVRLGIECKQQIKEKLLCFNIKYLLFRFKEKENALYNKYILQLYPRNSITKFIHSFHIDILKFFNNAGNSHMGELKVGCDLTVDLMNLELQVDQINIFLTYRNY